MEVEQTEEVVVETPEPEAPETPEVTDQAQINEWLDDRLGTTEEEETNEVEAEEVEATKMPMAAPVVEKP